MKHIITISMVLIFNLSSTYAATLSEKIGQMIMIGFSGTSAEDESAQQIGQKINEGLIGSVIFYQHNIKSPEQIKNLTDFLNSFAQPDDIPLFAIDQEGGLVQRLKEANGFTNYPRAKNIAEQSIEEAEKIYDRLSKELNTYNFNFNLAPVCDLDFGPESLAIGKHNRAFSDDPFIVQSFAEAFIKMHAQNNVLTCRKHYPGHGSAKGNKSDTHKGLVNVTKTWEEKELIPFASIDQPSCAIMTAHIVNAKLDESMMPATMSSKIIQEKLRNEMGYNGVVITDDLLMKAIWDHYSLEDIVLNTILAGCDILLISNYQKAFQEPGLEDASSLDFPERIRDIVLNLIEQGKLTEGRINESYERIKTFKQQLKRS